jgi:response regulator RpfG family c-di-GMP phosphodiesterase
VTRILVIDDETVIRALMAEILESAGYEIVCAETAERALALLEEIDVSLVVSDVVMPGLSGIELLDAVRARRASLPVVLVTGAGTYDTLSRALTRGAAGLITKPFAHDELVAAVEDALDRAAGTEAELRERLLAPTLASALANAIEARDSYLHGHCERLAALAVRLAELRGLPHDAVEQIRLGAILHDVGKIGIPDRVLLKPGPLDEEEYAVVREHPEIGDTLLAPLDLLATARPIVRHHHEWWNGAGYPDGLAGGEIPLGARIVAVADAIEVMCSRQLYRTPLTPDEILAELRRCRGTQWDAQVVDLALALIETGELELGPDGPRLHERTEVEPRAGLVPILLVEDDDDHAVLVTEALETAIGGARVARARTVQTAGDLMRGSTWSLAVIDHRLPDGSGVQVLDTMRANHPHVPIVMLAGQDSEETAIEAFRRGATDHVVKGGDYFDVLASRVRGLVTAGLNTPARIADGMRA